MKFNLSLPDLVRGVIALPVIFTIFAKRNAAVVLPNCARFQIWIQLKFMTEKN